MKLNKNQVKILRLLSEKGYRSVSALAENLKLSPSRTDVLVKDLRNLKLVEMERSGKAIEVRLAATKHAEAFRRLVALNPHMSFETVLTDRKIEVVLSLLRSPKTLRDLALELNISTRTVERTLAPLREYGVVILEKRAFYLNPQHGNLFEFIREFISYMNIKIAGADTVIIWEHLDEFIMEMKNPSKRVELNLTGYRALEYYGIPLILSDVWQYLYSPHKKRLRIEDVCLHIMMINPRSTRAITYIVMTILKNKEIWNWRYMESESKTYNFFEMTRKLRKFMETREKEIPEGFPSWEEIEEKAKEYDIHG